jgi:hypothetical protein
VKPSRHQRAAPQVLPRAEQQGPRSTKRAWQLSSYRLAVTGQSNQAACMCAALLRRPTAMENPHPGRLKRTTESTAGNERRRYLFL